MLYIAGCNGKTLFVVGDRVAPCGVVHQDANDMPYRIVQTFENGKVAVASFKSGQIRILDASALQTFD